MKSLMSEESYWSILTKYDKNDFEQVVYIMPTVINNPVNVGIVFGNPSMLVERISKAVELYHNGIIDKLLLTGGTNYIERLRHKAIPESILMRRYAILHGVKEKDIIVEDKSYDTISNVILSLRKISEEWELDNHTRLLLITSDFHLRRCLGIVDKYCLFDNEIYLAESKNGYSDRENWFSSNKGRHLILREALLLAKYTKTNKMSDFEMPIKYLSKKKKI